MLLFRYGKLVGLHLGPYLAICVYDYDIAKEMLAMEEASGRPNVFWNNIRMLDKRLGECRLFYFPLIIGQKETFVTLK